MSSPEARGLPPPCAEGSASVLPRHIVPTAFLLAILPAPLAAQAGEQAEGSARLVGMVVDRETGAPVEDVLVSLHFQDDSIEARLPDPALTNRRGRFVFGGLLAARYEIRMDRIGYRTLVDSVAPGKDVELRVEVQLVPQALSLEPLFVIASSRSRYLRDAGFYGRRDQGLGRFVTREDIEAKMPMEVSDLLRTMPGVRVTPPATFGRVASVLLRGGCEPEVYLDGTKTIKPFPIDQVLSPDDVEAVEVYQGSEVPARFASSGCGVVVIWTREPKAEGGKPFSWRRMAVALGFLLSAFFLTR